MDKLDRLEEALKLVNSYPSPYVGRERAIREALRLVIEHLQQCQTS